MRVVRLISEELEVVTFQALFALELAHVGQFVHQWQAQELVEQSHRRVDLFEVVHLSSGTAEPQVEVLHYSSVVKHTVR